MNTTLPQVLSALYIFWSEEASQSKLKTRLGAGCSGDPWA